MIDLDSLRFLRPAWLWGLLAVPPLGLSWHLRRPHRNGWRAHVDAHLLPHLLEGRHARGGRAGLATMLLATTLALLALAGPSWRTAPQPLQRGGTALVVALQLGSSTRAGDLPPSRLLQARARLADILAARAGAPVGLLVYADDAFVVAPLTDDAANVALFLDSLSPEVMPVDGDRPDRAIDLAVRLLRQAGARTGEILVVADGAPGAETVAAAARASAQGMRVSALGMGRERGATYRMADGRLAQARLDAVSLQAMSAAGGGTYRGWDATWSDLATGGPPGGGATASGSATAPVPLDGGYWLLPVVLALVLLAFRRGAGAVALAVCLCLPWQPPARAQAGGTAWRRPDQVAHARQVDAEAAYRRGNFAAAADAWAPLAGADADYNRGNALARAGRYEDAIAAYDDALQAQPAHADAAANRAAVRAAMQRKPPPGPRDGSRGKQDDPGSKTDEPQPGAGKPGADGTGKASEAGAGNPPPGDPPRRPDASP
ncbi:MAG TPA: VWA domain-containing protein, partial [Luteimonas sp.]|nr:VWA domain-containing protein [Luteimonas sp.]